MAITDAGGSPAVRGPSDLDDDWLTDVLSGAGILSDGARVDGHTTEAIGTGQMSECHRVGLHYANAAHGPDSLVLKVAASDPTSRATGTALGAYVREVRFYRDVARSLGVPVAQCYHSEVERETGWFSLLLEDLTPARQGDDVAGAGLADAEAAVDALAGIHAARWDDPALRSTRWLNARSPLDQALLSGLLDGFVERYGDRLDPAHVSLAERFVPVLDAWAADDAGPHALQHGDFRLDNLLFATDRPERPVVAVDWQTVFYGPALHDLPYFLGCSLRPEDRRAHGEALVRRYHDALTAAGVRDLSWEDCWELYRKRTFGGLTMSLAASMLVERTDRGDDMFMATFARHAQQAIDLDAASLLPAPGTVVRRPHLEPRPIDEGRHAPGEEELWNESWYFDFTTTESGLAGYTRLGLYPNRDEAWVTLALVRAGGPTLRFVDTAAAVPESGSLAVASDAGLRADHVCVEPLRRFSVSLAATAERFEDAAAILRDERGRPVPVTMDLTWETDGAPYQYRTTTRYEIPCRVRGTVSIDGEAFAIDGHGQRDHSWGLRDWWAMDWMWSAGRLEDGTRVHATHVRLPGRPPIGMGYVQAPGAALEELGAMRTSESTDASGLVVDATIDLESAGLQLMITPIGDGPLLMTADDGRTTRFLRSSCAFEAADGRRGLGWVEWNHNQGRA
jgi:aminoglycoside phosphotransferase (APT) family kinase protein